MPKEIRKLKSELRCTCGDTWAEYGDWSDADLRAVRGLLILRDVPAEDNVPRNLMERTARFGEAIIKLAKRVPRSPVNDRLISQVVAELIFRISAFGILSDFGFRTSDFYPCFSPA